MERVHEEQLRLTLEKLVLEAAVTLRWEQLYIWFSAERLSKGAWREIHRVWQEVCEAMGRKPSNLKILKRRKGTTYVCILARSAFADEEVIDITDWM